MRQLSPALETLLAEAKTESFLVSRGEPQCGHFVPFTDRERIRISLSRPHLPQENS
jgi:hypothetical protein